MPDERPRWCVATSSYTGLPAQDACCRNSLQFAAASGGFDRTEDAIAIFSSRNALMIRDGRDNVHTMRLREADISLDVPVKGRFTLLSSVRFY